MDRVSQSSQGYKLESQIREAYGRVTYTQTSHDKMINRLLNNYKNLRLWQIILSALTTSGFIFSIVLDGRLASILGAIVSLILLLLNSYAKNFNLIEISLDHKIASDKLWKIREEYVSLLTDFDCLEREEIIKRRDNLQQRTHEVYVSSPRTDR